MKGFFPHLDATCFKQETRQGVIAVKGEDSIDGRPSQPRAFATPRPFEFSCLSFPLNPRTCWDEQIGARILQILQKKSRS